MKVRNVHHPDFCDKLFFWLTFWIFFIFWIFATMWGVSGKQTEKQTYDT